MKKEQRNVSEVSEAAEAAEAEQTTLRLPHNGPRVETGPVQFGDDWPGVFIRGDNAFGYAMALRAFLHGVLFYREQVIDLLDLLLSCNLSLTEEDRQRIIDSYRAHESKVNDLREIVDLQRQIEDREKQHAKKYPQGNLWGD